MTIHVPNPEVLQAGFANIAANLSYWNQVTWIQQERFWVPSDNTCGTTACLAGHILLGQGWTWRDLLNERTIPAKAMMALGYTEIEVPVWCDFCEENHLETSWSGDGVAFEVIFYRMRDSSDEELGYTQAAFDEFKAYVTQMTGVEL